jgi:FKBP-type peptidyl-prolyl cis-trans isomerase
MMLALLFASAVAVTMAKPAPPPDLKAPPADAQTSADGLVSRQLVLGVPGEHPGSGDSIHVRYAVWKASDGSVVDFTRGEAATFVDTAKLLPGMREMFELMTPGEKRRAWIAPSLGAGKIKEGETFVVDGELVDIVHPPATPVDVVAPPGDAVKMPSGLAYKILNPGNGTAHPGRNDKVLVHYSGWTTDGRMFDSSVTRGEPVEFGLGEVIPGWTQGLQLMTAGEKVRLWIPEKLAYKGQAGKPAGMLVFDVELLRIK